MKRIKLILVFFMMAMAVFAQSGIEGKWKSVDEETGEITSVVKITIRGGKLFGKIIELTEADDPNQTCTECTDYRKGQKVIGMEIITNLDKRGGVWEGDDGILDPENGKIYDCKIWLEDGKLKVRGYISFLYRTQTWIRA